MALAGRCGDLVGRSKGLECAAMLKIITVIAGNFDGRRRRIEYIHLTDTLNEAILRMHIEGHLYDFASIELQEDDLTFVIDSDHRISRARVPSYRGDDRRKHLADRRQGGAFDRRRNEHGLFRRALMGIYDHEITVDRRCEKADRRREMGGANGLEAGRPQIQA